MNISYDKLSRMEDIKHFFIIIIKNVLNDVCKTIMGDLVTEYFSRLRGRVAEVL